MIPPPAHRLGFNISPGTDYHGMRLVSRNKSKNNHKKKKQPNKKLNFCPEAYMSHGRSGVLGVLRVLKILVWESKHPTVLWPALLVYYIPFLCSFLVSPRRQSVIQCCHFLFSVSFFVFCLNFQYCSD